MGLSQINSIRKRRLILNREAMEEGETRGVLDVERDERGTERSQAHPPSTHVTLLSPSLLSKVPRATRALTRPYLWPGQKRVGCHLGA